MQIFYGPALHFASILHSAKLVASRSVCASDYVVAVQ